MRISLNARQEVSQFGHRTTQALLAYLAKFQYTRRFETMQEFHLFDERDKALLGDFVSIPIDVDFSRSSNVERLADILRTRVLKVAVTRHRQQGLREIERAGDIDI